MRTLETIRNISTDEAKTFQRIIPLIMYKRNVYLLLSDEDILNRYELSFADIQTLDDCGLVNSSGTLSINMRVSKNEPQCILSDTFIIIIRGKKEKGEKISFGIYTLTRAGLELFNILTHEPNLDYTIQVANHIFSRNPLRATTSVHKLISFKKDVDEAKIQYEGTPLATYPEEIAQ